MQVLMLTMVGILTHATRGLMLALVQTLRRILIFLGGREMSLHLQILVLSSLRALMSTCLGYGLCLRAILMMTCYLHRVLTLPGGTAPCQQQPGLIH